MTHIAALAGVFGWLVILAGAVVKGYTDTSRDRGPR